MGAEVRKDAKAYAAFRDDEFVDETRFTSECDVNVDFVFSSFKTCIRQQASSRCGG